MIVVPARLSLLTISRSTATSCSPHEEVGSSITRISASFGQGLQHFDNLASARWKVLHFLIGIHIEAMSIGQGTGVCEHSIFAVGAEQPAARLLHPSSHVRQW